MVHPGLSLLILVFVSYVHLFYWGFPSFSNICLRRHFRHRRFDLCCLHHQHVSAIAVTAMIFIALHPWNMSFDSVFLLFGACSSSIRNCRPTSMVAEFVLFFSVWNGSCAAVSFDFGFGFDWGRRHHSSLSIPHTLQGTTSALKVALRFRHLWFICLI